MPLTEKCHFFFSIALKSALFGLKHTLYHIRGLFLVYTSALVIWAAFTAFQELINCCMWWMSAAESLGKPPEGLCGCEKYLECNIDMVEWFTQVLEEI